MPRYTITMEHEGVGTCTVGANSPAAARHVWVENVREIARRLHQRRADGERHLPDPTEWAAASKAMSFKGKSGLESPAIHGWRIVLRRA